MIQAFPSHIKSPQRALRGSRKGMKKEIKRKKKGGEHYKTAEV